MKRTYDNIQNANNSGTKPNVVLEGVVVAITDIFDGQTDKKGKYWTALICDVNQNVNRITKYLSSKTKCRLHEKMTEHLNNKNGVKLNKLKWNGDYTYTATNETIAAPKIVSFTPLCTQLSSLQDIEAMPDGQYTTFMCKIVDIGPDDVVIFNNGEKRIQKLKRTTIVADKTGSLNMNLWQNQFESIKENLSYIIKMAKVKVFNDDVSVTATIHTSFESIQDIGDVSCPNPIDISHESTVIGTITSIGLVEENLTCPKCYSTQIENNGTTIKCLACKSRTIQSKERNDQTKIKLTIIDTNQNTYELIVDPSKVKVLLEQSNSKELCQEDLVEQEAVLLALSSLNVGATFNPKNKHIIDIEIKNMVSEL